jgi:pyocin large subunit-like protein
MTNQRQKRANRANALRSTGPRTPKGRAAIALNAVRHGLLCGDRILPGEDLAAFNDLRNGVRADIAPSGPIEQLLADRVISAIWRLRRLENAECALFTWHIYQQKAARLAKNVGSYVNTTFDFPFNSWGGESTITNRSAHARAIKELRKVEVERDRGELDLARVLDADGKEGETFSKLTRYEAAIERSLFRSLAELRQMKAVR